ncbi:hypothetical protein Ahy_B06g081277 isoform C [Arachis hypogaea]|uniref:Uncharacterized protein n=1 Tax=Arachis hypogaea TaxID=3818 RepID=A0A444YKW5_ARAHY|nr:hypothetical protein Ahy_B06g081277 isoform C [Arachis hypogaea]
MVAEWEGCTLAPFVLISPARILGAIILIRKGKKKSLPELIGSWREGAEAFLTLPIEASAGVKCKMHKGVFASLRSEWEGKGMD